MVSLRIEVYIWNIVIMSEKSFEAEIVIIEIPQFYCEIRRARSQVSSLVVVVDAIDWILDRGSAY